MSTDHQATALLIQMMPLLMREFRIRLDPELFFADRQYADTVIGLAADDGASERLRGIAECLRIRLLRLTAGPAGAARSLPMAAAPEPTLPTQAPAAAAAAAPAPSPPAAAAADAGRDDGGAARRYVRSLR